MKNLFLELRSSLIHSFYIILQSGFFIKCRAGISVQALLCDNFGLHPGYVNERVTTVFLDGSCVDNLERAFIKKGSIVSFSSAMPGLAGATMRRGSIYTSLRSAITYNENANVRNDADVMVKIKIFNLLIDELGQVFLQKGIFLKESDIIEFLKGQNKVFWDGCSSIVVDGTKIDKEFLLSKKTHPHSDFVRVSIDFT